MEEKVTVATYIIMHLTVMDFVVGFVGAFIRILGDYVKAKHKVDACREEPFLNSIYFAQNWDKIFYGLVSGLGFLLIVPELMIDVSDLIFSRKILWNTAYSGIVGLTGVEIAAGIILRMKLKFRTPAEHSHPGEEKESLHEHL